MYVWSLAVVAVTLNTDRLTYLNPLITGVLNKITHFNAPQSDDKNDCSNRHNITKRKYVEHYLAYCCASVLRHILTDIQLLELLNSKKRPLFYGNCNYCGIKCVDISKAKIGKAEDWRF